MSAWTEEEAETHQCGLWSTGYNSTRGPIRDPKSDNFSLCGRGSYCDRNNVAWRLT